MWRKDHDIAHKCYLSGRIPQTLSAVSDQRAEEFEAALVQRGNEARERFLIRSEQYNGTR